MPKFVICNAIICAQIKLTQDDRKIEHVMDRYQAFTHKLFCQVCTAGRSFVPQDDGEIGYVKF
jgi:hypothetical protein